MNLENDIEEFLAQFDPEQIYNEFSLQHELGIFLRARLSEGCKVQFERNINYFGLTPTAFVKREIDLSITDRTRNKYCAIELKFPRNGQVPEAMFSFCKDIAFLEQLVHHGFGVGYFLALADHPGFYSPEGKLTDIYGYFRNSQKITGTITKPTGDKDQQVKIQYEYSANWKPVGVNKIYGNTKYCLLKVTATR